MSHGTDRTFVSSAPLGHSTRLTHPMVEIAATPSLAARWARTLTHLIDGTGPQPTREDYAELSKIIEQIRDQVRGA